MSITPLNLRRAFAKFAQRAPLRVTETEGQRVNGRYQRVELPERFIRAVVLAINTERLEFLSSGDATISGINVMTDATLYFTKATEAEPVNKQSFVHYKGQKYRVVVDGLTEGNATFNSYDCLLYVDRQDEQ